MRPPVLRVLLPAVIGLLAGAPAVMAAAPPSLSAAGPKVRGWQTGLNVDTNGKPLVSANLTRRPQSYSVEAGRSTYSARQDMRSAHLTARLGRWGHLRLHFIATEPAHPVSLPSGCQQKVPTMKRRGFLHGTFQLALGGRVHTIVVHRLRATLTRPGSMEYGCPGGSTRVIWQLALKRPRHRVHFTASRLAGGRAFLAAGDSFASGRARLYRTMSTWAPHWVFTHTTNLRRGQVLPYGRFRGALVYQARGRTRGPRTYRISRGHVGWGMTVRFSTGPVLRVRPGPAYMVREG